MANNLKDDTGRVSPAEAREILSRFVASHFRDGREKARFSIPADPKRDDDIRMLAFIQQTEELLARVE